jgi:hypothetical protein
MLTAGSLEAEESHFQATESNIVAKGEEYCGAITQVAKRSRCGQSGFSASEFGFQLDSLPSTHIIGRICMSSDLRRIRLALKLPERYCCASRGVYIDAILLKKQLRTAYNG